MSVEDRDWYREDFKRKEKEYGGDFSLNSEPKHKKKSTGKKKKQQLAQPARPAISSWRRTLNSVLMILLCAILTASSCYTFFEQSGCSVRMYAPMLLLEICLFKYAYDTSKTAEKPGILNFVALLLCGMSIIMMALFTILSILNF